MSCCKIALFVVAVVVAIILIIAGIVLGVYFGTNDRDDNNDTTRFVSSSGKYRNAAIASDSALCSKVGANILESEGSAVDGAIATIFCLGVVNCHSTGIGGGGFMVVHKNDDPNNPVVIDFREVAPSAATRYMYDENEILSRIGKSSCKT